jgi:hypothetical protein
MKRFFFKALDIIGGGFIYLAGVVLWALFYLGKCTFLVLGLISSLAFPAFCIIAAWGILKYFGVI